MDELPHLEDVPCDACGGAEVSTIRPARAEARTRADLARIYRASSDAPLVDRLVQCRSCDLVFVSPRVRATTLVEAYSEGDDPVFISQAAARERTFARSLARIEELTGGPGRIFDIGTAGGSFLAAARARGWEVDGCEPNRWLVDWGKRTYGLDIRPGPLTDHNPPEASYDVVTLWDVIEHVPSPSDVIERAKRLVKPGGLLVLTFPDVESPSARLLGRFWPFYSSVHLYYFSKRTMGRLLAGKDFEVVKTGAHTQELELAYVLHRAGDVLGAPMRRIASWLRERRVGRAHTPYRLGQTFLAARRVLEVTIAADYCSTAFCLVSIGRATLNALP